MKELTVNSCPNCSGNIVFSHPGTNLLQCTCGTVIQRTEGCELLAKPFYIVQQTGDSIQPGTTGSWEGKPFTVLGRCQAWFERAVYNFWTIVFSDGELAYLSEGYGMYAVLKKTSVDQFLTNGFLISLKTGDRKNLRTNIDFLLERRLLCKKWEVEGEHWLPGCGEQFTVFDFAGQNGTYVTLIQFLSNDVVPFEVYYTSFSSLRLANTRTVTPQGKTFTCTNCNQSISVISFPYAQSCACSGCGMRYNLQEVGFKSTGNYGSLDSEPDIVLGSRGRLFGIEYEVVGFCLKEENSQYRSRWKEYTLFNREEGFAFLSEYAGHWVYVREQGRAPVLPNKGSLRSFVFEGEDFQLYNSYTFSVLQAKGEFPRNALSAGGTHVKEFISPPEVWIYEQNKTDGIVWFLGQHVEGKTLRSQFQLAGSLPSKEGIGAVEPKFFINPTKLVRMAAIGIAFLLCLQVIVQSTKQNRVLVDENYLFSQELLPHDSPTTVSFVTPPFHLDKWRSNLEFEIVAPVDNDWFELNATLVNQKTGTEYSLEKGVEYYHGYTDGEGWSEGSGRELAFMSQIPEGDYILQVQGSRSTGYNPVQNFHLKVTYDTMMERNFWFSVLALVLWPLVQWGRTRSIEKKRWYNSPYSPFSYEN